MDKIKLYKNDVKFNNKGNVYKYIQITNAFKKISEVYFSKIKKNLIKGWKKNKSSNQFFYVFQGKIILKIYDDRGKDKKKYSFIIGNNSFYSKILIPKNVWYGFKGLGKENLIINSLENLYKNCEMQTLKIKNNYRPIDWKKN